MTPDVEVILPESREEYIKYFYTAYSVLASQIRLTTNVRFAWNIFELQVFF